jgi:hypothetical protein
VWKGIIAGLPSFRSLSLVTLGSGTQGFFFLVSEKIPVGSEKSGFQKYKKYRSKYR